jgi:hypothetical protein
MRIEKVLYALAWPHRESLAFVLVSARILTMVAARASNSASPEAIARSEAHRFLFSCSHAFEWRPGTRRSE